MRKSEQDLRIIFLHSGGLYDRITKLSCRGKTRRADAQIFCSVYHIAARRSAVQYRRSDIYRQRRLSRLLRQRGEHRRFSSDRDRARRRRLYRGRMLRYGKRSARRRKGGQGAPLVRQRDPYHNYLKRGHHCRLSDIRVSHRQRVRREREQRNL